MVERLESAVADRDALIAQQAAVEAFDRDNHWRVERLEELTERIGRIWTDAVIQAARDGHPAAYGTNRLHAARDGLAKRIIDVEADPCAGLRGTQRRTSRFSTTR